MIPTRAGMIKLTSEDPCEKKRGAFDLVISTMDENIFPGISNDYRNMRIVDASTNQLVACGPSLPLPFEVFLERYPLSQKDVIVRAMVEGTWIMLFYHRSQNRWEICTRGTIGGRAWYTRLDYEVFKAETPQKTYREMFLDILGIADLTEEAFPLLKTLPQTDCYSFLLQHRENPIVFPVYENQLVLDVAFRIDSSTNTVLPTDWTMWKAVKGVTFPKYLMRGVESYDLLKDYFDNPLNTHPESELKPHHLVKLIFPRTQDKKPDLRCGILIINACNGDRTIVRNPLYEEIKKFRGNHPNLQFQYFELAKQKQLTSYLTIFPMFKPMFDAFQRDFLKTCSALYKVYEECFLLPGARKKKTGQQEVIPRVSKRHFVKASNIHHNIYIASIQAGNRKVINLDRVREFLYGLSTQQLIHYLNTKDEIDQ